jgi:hypothetical protein
VTIRVHGLAPFERTAVRYHGRIVKRGKADTAGAFSIRLAVGRTLGKQRVVVMGKFGDIRHGRAILRVIR